MVCAVQPIRVMKVEFLAAAFTSKCKHGPESELSVGRTPWKSALMHPWCQPYRICHYGFLICHIGLKTNHYYLYVWPFHFINTENKHNYFHLKILLWPTHIPVQTLSILYHYCLRQFKNPTADNRLALSLVRISVQPSACLLWLNPRLNEVSFSSFCHLTCYVQSLWHKCSGLCPMFRGRYVLCEDANQWDSFF